MAALTRLGLWGHNTRRTSSFAGKARVIVPLVDLGYVSLDDGVVTTLRLDDGRSTALELTDGVVTTLRLDEGRTTALELTDGHVTLLTLRDEK